MNTIPRTFFITAMGRSGTNFLADTLNRSEQFRVVHEWRIPGTPYQDVRLTRFPLHRFWLARYPFPALRRGYGEVNSYLRTVLSPNFAGAEGRVARRGILLRDPREIVTSVMNRGGRVRSDFPASCRDVVYWCAHLMRLLRSSKIEYTPFHFRPMTRDPDYVLEIARWAGIDDLDTSAVSVDHSVNANDANWFPSWPEWSAEEREIFDRNAGEHAVNVEEFIG